MLNKRCHNKMLEFKNLVDDKFYMLVAAYFKEKYCGMHCIAKIHNEHILWGRLNTYNDFYSCNCRKTK